MTDLEKREIVRQALKDWDNATHKQRLEALRKVKFSSIWEQEIINVIVSPLAVRS